MMPEATTSIRRLNWGCGPVRPPGWTNSDVADGPGVDLVCDIRRGIPLPDATFDYIVSIHGLQALAFADVLPALRELRRLLKPGGVLRLGLPDLDRAVHAYVRGDRSYFYIHDDQVRSLGGKLAVQVTWYGSTRTPFTWDFIEELCAAAGFRRVVRCAYRETASDWPDIVALDNRPRESLFVEAST